MNLPTRWANAATVLIPTVAIFAYAVSTLQADTTTREWALIAAVTAVPLVLSTAWLLGRRWWGPATAAAFTCLVGAAGAFLLAVTATSCPSGGGRCDVNGTLDAMTFAIVFVALVLALIGATGWMLRSNWRLGSWVVRRVSRQTRPGEQADRH